MEIRTRRFSPRRAGVVLLVALLAAGATLFRRDAFPAQNGITPGHARLVRALDGYRMTEPRFVGGFSYAPCVVRNRPDGLISRADCSPGQDPVVDRFQALAAALEEIRSELKAEPGPASMRASAVQGMILRGKEERLDRWVERLERAVQESTEDAGLHSDLAGAYFLRAQDENAPLDLARALAQAAQAVELDPHLAEARFNHALALQNLYLPQLAIRSWQKFLEIDGESEWAVEARSRIASLEELTPPAPSEKGIRATVLRAVEASNDERLRELASSYPHLLRKLARDTFMLWADAVLDSGDEGPPQRQAKALGCAFAATANDTFLLEAAQGFAHAEPPLRADLAAGYRRFEAGVSALFANRLADADQEFAEAKRLLASGRSPFAQEAEFQQARCAYLLAKPDKALAIGRRIAGQAKPYPDLRGRAAWLSGTVLLERVQTTAALAAYKAALSAFETSGDFARQSAVHSLLANTYGVLADPRSAWEERYRGLRTAARATDTERLPVLLGEAARAALQDGWPRIALALQNEALELHAAADDPLGIAGSLWWRGVIHYRVGDTAGAWEDLEEGERTAAGISDELGREVIQAGLQTLRGALTRTVDPAAATEVLTKALGAYQAVGMDYLLVDVLHERARARLAQGQVAAAGEDLERGILQFEKQRAQVDGAQSRIRFFDKAEAIFEDMVRFQSDEQRNPWAAFAFVERGKARTLLEALAGDSGDTLTTLHQRLGEGQALVEYFQLENRLLAWIVTRRDGERVEIPASAAAIDAAVARFRESLEDGGASVESASRDLASLIWGPVREPLDGYHEIIIVPDRSLHAVPFAALVDPARGNYLVEDHTITIAPSSATYLAAMDRVRDGWLDTAPQVLAIGEPARSDVEPLPDALEEAEEVARRYPGSLLLTGEDANRERFLAELDRFDIIHVAAHALANTDSPFRSRLLLAPAAGTAESEGDVYADEIVAQGLRRPQLAVLSACSTATGHGARLEGVSDLGRAFAAAGVPATLVTLWNVRDTVARQFFDRFYEYLGKAVGPAEALRRAQLDLLRNPDPRLRAPIHWAGFELVGAGILTTER